MAGWRKYRWPAALLALAAVATVAGLLLDEAAVSGRTPAERVTSICRLADERPRGAARAIARAAADDPDGEVRRVAVLALGRFAEGEFRPVVEAASRDPAPAIRTAAAGALSDYRDDASAERLGEMARSDPDESVRSAAVAALHLHGSARAGEVLVETVQHAGQSPLGTKAFDALTELVEHRWPHGPRPWAPARWEKVAGQWRRLAGGQSDGPKVISHDGNIVALPESEP